jgi:hypothetical protein
MNSLCIYTKQTNIGYDLCVIEIPRCLIFLLNPNFHLIKDKKNKNKRENFQ